MREIVIHIPGSAVQWSRAGRNGGRHFTPAAQKNYKRIVSRLAQIELQRSPMLYGALTLSSIVQLVPPKSWPRWKREGALLGHIGPTVKPDFDNWIKLPADALNEVMYPDDCYVTTGEITKCYAQFAAQTLIIKETGQLPAQCNREEYEKFIKKTQK